MCAQCSIVNWWNSIKYLLKVNYVQTVWILFSASCFSLRHFVYLDKFTLFIFFCLLFGSVVSIGRGKRFTFFYRWKWSVWWRGGDVGVCTFLLMLLPISFGCLARQFYTFATSCDQMQCSLLIVGCCGYCCS